MTSPEGSYFPMSIRVTGLPTMLYALLLGLTAGVGSVCPALAQPAAVTDSLPVATDARLGGDDQQTRFVLDLSQKIHVRAFALADPYRVVLDIPQVSFKLPSKLGETGRGLVKAFRYGLVMQGGSRIVLDVGKPVRIDKAFVIDAADGQPARLVLDLVATDRESFLRTIALDRKPPRPESPKSDPASAKQAGDPRPLIVIDPGHGGIDNGTQAAATGVLEKTIVLEFGTMLRDKLEKSGKYRVAMTRTDDTFVALDDRVRFARDRQAALLISIHCDALRKIEGDAQGASIYTLSDTASDSEAGRLADAENKADVIAGFDLSGEPNEVADILVDLAQRETKTYSLQFAKNLIGEIKGVARLHKQPLKAAGFKVLKAPDVPSVLVELGYVSNAQDLKLLSSDAWRSKTADAIAQAVGVFFSTRLAGTGTGADVGLRR